ncbi:hypothetical protein M422DRAFT_268780 [Sphaerobolus stellatus SS14]|uniref:Uncharacterized protein n=1 Tax=Sphaerobolus stellatus (strain SS14) TaxID=990650 RepID=A0A0C9ULM8_SPHS4|nr:hypothetical protein M422DRAFT_268780 [Sphaerobolus stellatus SS14]
MDDCGDRTTSSGVDGEQRTDDEQRGEKGLPKYYAVEWQRGTAVATSGRNGDDELAAVERRRTGGGGTTTDGWRWNDDGRVAMERRRTGGSSDDNERRH